MNKISSSAKSYYDKTTYSYRYKHDPYLKVKNLLKVHKDLVEDEDYVDSNRWLEHLENELMKFWLKPEVKEIKNGLYRSFFTNDGTALPGLDQVELWPKALREAIKKTPDGNYTSEAGDLLDGETLYPKQIFHKAHCWKNALHTFEHVLFGYVTSKQLL